VPSVTGFTSKLRTPQYQEWNFQIQQELDSRSRVTLAYVGNHGIFEPYPNNTGNASAAAGTVFGYPSATPDARFGTVTQWQSGAVSNFNGLTASYSRRMTAGFVINGNYVWTEPFHFGNPILNGVLGGWLLSNNFTVRSGLPFTVTDGTTVISNG